MPACSPALPAGAVGIRADSRGDVDRPDGGASPACLERLDSLERTRTDSNARRSRDQRAASGREISRAILAAIFSCRSFASATLRTPLQRTLNATVRPSGAIT